MAGWDGNGNVTLTHDWTDDRDAAIKITASRMDTQQEDIRGAIENTIAKDGQNTPTADLPMGGQKHTGVGNASARNHYPSVGQIQDQALTFVAAAGTVDALTATFSPAVTALVDGMEFAIRASGANTSTTPTLNVNSIGAKTITKLGNQALLAGDIRASGHEMRLRYHSSGDRFELLNPAAVVTKADVLDEDDMSSDSATQPPSQQSTKAYVDGLGWKQVSTATFSSSANFDLSLSTDYKRYEIHLEEMLPANNNVELHLLVSDDNNTTRKTTAYAWQKLQLNGGTTPAPTSASNGSEFEMTGAALSNTGGETFQATIHISQHADSGRKVYVRWEVFSYQGSSSNPYEWKGGGIYTVDADIDAIRIQMSAGNIASGNAVVLGLRV